MVDYKKKYLKYKKKYLQSKKIFNKKSLGGALPASPVHSLRVASESAQVLARTLLDEVMINLTNRVTVMKEEVSLGRILTERNVLDTYNIGMPQIQNLKDSIARKLTNFPLGDHPLAQVECKAQHGVLAYDSWVKDAFRAPGNYDLLPLTDRIRNFLNQNIEYNCYTDVIKWILGREFSNSKQIRHILESKVGAQNQCNRIINEFEDGTICYLCGIQIDTFHTGTPHCEHLIPVGQALAIYWLAKKTDFSEPEKVFLRNEYKWSCSCCNRLKGNDQFINPPTLYGTLFMISDDVIRNFVIHLCNLIGNTPLPEDLRKLNGTETLDILCQRKQLYLNGECTNDYQQGRRKAIGEAFDPVLKNINYNFLKKGGAESGKRNIIESGRAEIFLELTKIEMMVKIILALGDEGLVELFCKTDVPRRSVAQLNPSRVPVFTKIRKKVGRRVTVPKILRKKVGRVEDLYKSRRKKINYTKNPRQMERDERRKKKMAEAIADRKATEAEEERGRVEREKAARDRQNQDRAQRRINRDKDRQAGGKTLSKLIPSLLQDFEKPELKEKIHSLLQDFEKPELKEKIYTVDKENADTGLEKLKSEDPQVIKEKCIDPRGFTKYLLFEILEEIIEYLPKNNIFILFVIKLLIDDDMNTLFFETYYTKNNTQFEILINDLKEIIENWKIPPTEV